MSVLKVVFSSGSSPLELTNVHSESDDKLYEAFEVVVLLEKHRGIKLFRLTVLAKQC